MRLQIVKFPLSSPEAMGAAKEFLATICPHKEALEWLIAELVNKVGTWPGSADVRGLLSCKYMPADGIRTDCGILGYRPADFEAQEIDRHYERMAGYKGPQHDLKRAIGEIAPKLLDGKKL